MHSTASSRAILVLVACNDKEVFRKRHLQAYLTIGVSLFITPPLDAYMVSILQPTTNQFK
jgi:hypothetical protein